MTDNLDIWNRLGKTAPQHTKGFKRAGGFGGTAIKPIYTEQKMTEVFGPAGKGWGMGEPQFQVVPGNDGQIAVYCTVSLWWNDPVAQSGPHMVYGVGGDMVVVKQSSGLRTDDEAFKKAFTDAVGNAMKHLGMSADVHMGLFDDSKYVREREAEEAGADRHTGEVPVESLGKPVRGDLPKQLVKVSREAEKQMRDEIDACPTVEELRRLWRSKPFQDEFEKLQPVYQQGLVTTIDERTAFLTEHPGKVPPNFDNLDATFTPDVS